MAYFVYIIQSLKDRSYYVGSTQDLFERLDHHNQGRSKYTKAKRPWKLIYVEEHEDRSEAVRKENKIKARKSKEYIESLVRKSRPQGGKVAHSPRSGTQGRASSSPPQ
jgi:putative endonuclease